MGGPTKLIDMPNNAFSSGLNFPATLDVVVVVLVVVLLQLLAFSVRFSGLCCLHIRRLPISPTRGWGWGSGYWTRIQTWELHLMGACQCQATKGKC